jgi:nucleotide-binding universal stress UspA family protein
MSENQNGTTKRGPAVVVGVDGSAGAKDALLWALAEARLRHWPLRAVHAWMFGYIGGSVEGLCLIHIYEPTTPISISDGVLWV